MRREPTARVPRAGYSSVAIVIHWLIAALLIFEVALGLNMESAKGAERFAVFQLHKSVGITILLLALLRLVWRLRHRPPPLTATGWEKALAQVVHAAFYVLLLGLPLSGWLVVSASKIAVPTLLYGTIPWPHVPGVATLAATAKEAWHAGSAFVHVNLVNVLYAMFALHVTGALKHHLIDRDGEIARMVPGTRTGSWSDPRLLLIGATTVAVAAIGLSWGSNGAPHREPVGTGSVATGVQPPMVTPSLAAPSLAPTTPATETAVPDESVTAAAKQELSSWIIQPGSSLKFRTTWSGAAINGGFAKFGGDILFSPDELDNSKVTVTVDTSSATSGDSERDETLKGADWFAVSASRDAVFAANRFRRIGPERYTAEGTLRMKGVTAAIAVPFSLRIAGDEATMHGSATINRLAYKIGEGEFASTAEIPAAVQVDIVLKARRR